MSDPSANGILQFMPNDWSTNTTGLQLVYEYQFMPNRLVNGIGNLVQAKQLVYEYTWSTTGLRIPVYTQPIG